MKIPKNTIGKRILAVLLSLLTVLSCMTIGFAPAYALDSTAKEWNGHHRFSVDGKDAYCINYGQASNGKFETNAVQIVVQVFCNALKRPKINNFSAQKNILNGHLHQIFKPYIVPNYAGFYLSLRTTHYYILYHGW